MVNPDPVRSVPVLSELMNGADHVDVKCVEGRKTMRGFIAAMLAYQPGWLCFLYRIRAVFVRLLGMRQDEVPADESMTEDDVSLTPGDTAAFFTVTAAEEDRYWVAEASDKHLSGWIGVVTEPLESGSTRFHTFTVVRYRHWTGPLYFNIIRPFHHIVVEAMIRHAVR